jgi:hypothetical protein
MFGILTGWLDECVKMWYLNTTEDVLNCFQQNISTLPFPAQNFFWNLSIAPELWTQRGAKVIKNIKLKACQYFYFFTIIW